MLRALNKLSPVSTCVVLIVGAPGVGKHQLAKAILGLGSSVTLQIRTATSLPLPEANAATRPRIDYIILMVDLTNRESYMTVKQSVKHIDVAFYTGKLCFVLSQVHSVVRHGVAVESVIELAESYCSEWLSCNLQNDGETRWLAQQLLNKVELSRGLSGGLSPLQVEATSQSHTITVDERRRLSMGH